MNIIIFNFFSFLSFPRSFLFFSFTSLLFSHPFPFSVFFLFQLLFSLLCFLFFDHLPFCFSSSSFSFFLLFLHHPHFPKKYSSFLSFLTLSFLHCLLSPFCLLSHYSLVFILSFLILFFSLYYLKKNIGLLFQRIIFYFHRLPAFPLKTSSLSIQTIFLTF